MPKIKKVISTDPLEITEKFIPIGNAAAVFGDYLATYVERLWLTIEAIGADSIACIPPYCIKKRPNNLKRGSWWIEITDGEIEQALELMKHDCPLAEDWDIQVRKVGGQFRG